MLTMIINELLEHFKFLSAERTKRRDKLVALLEQASKEFDSLATCWSEIAAFFAAEPVIEAKVNEKLIHQRGHYEALRIHLVNLNSDTAPPSSVRERLLEYIESAIDLKGDLYGRAYQLLTNKLRSSEGKEDYGDYSSINMKDKLAYAKMLVDLNRLSPEMRTRMIDDLQAAAEDLSGVAGQFRTAVSIFKSETPFF